MGVTPKPLMLSLRSGYAELGSTEDVVYNILIAVFVTYSSLRSENCCSRYCISSKQSPFLRSPSSSSSTRRRKSSHRNNYQLLQFTSSLHMEDPSSELEESSSPLVFASLGQWFPFLELVPTGMAAKPSYLPIPVCMYDSIPDPTLA